MSLKLILLSHITNNTTKAILLMMALSLPNIALAKKEEKEWEVDPLLQPALSFRYTVLAQPTVDFGVDHKNKKTISKWAPISLGFLEDYPLNKYFTVGFSTQLSVLTNKIKGVSYTSVIFDLDCLLRPRLPIMMPHDKMIVLYSSLELGLTTLLAKPLHLYRGDKIQRVPSFGFGGMMMFGIEYVISSWTACYLESGLKYRLIGHLLIMPPLGTPEEKSAKKENRNFFYYDIVAIPISFGLKFFI